MTKKQLIMDSALELFAEQGLGATSIQQITEHCGISKGAFYLSFKSKNELVLALIDHFSMKTISAFDHLVRNTSKEELLYAFYDASYRHFDKYANFTKIFIKESQAFNEDIIIKVHYYNQMQEEIILTIIERVYGDSIKYIKFDLLFCIKSFLKMYAELILFKNIKLDFDILASSLVEKTNVLAMNMTIPFLNEEHLQRDGIETTTEQLIEIIEQTVEKLEESVIKESFTILHAELLGEHLSPAIIRGLIENIRSQPQFEWIARLLKSYYDIK